MAKIDAGVLPVERGLVLSDDDHRRRRVILDLFCNFRTTLDWSEFPREREALAGMEADGLLVRRADGIDVTPLGRHFIRNVCATFDAYLEADNGARRYSATA